MTTPYENLTNANHDYHEAVDELLAEEIIPVGVKAKLGGYADSIFALMKNINKLLKEYYE